MRTVGTVGTVGTAGTAGTAGAAGAAGVSGAVAALVCAVHCLVAPGLALVGAGLGVPEGVERGVMGAGVLLGAGALWTGYGVHGRLGPAVLAAAGVGTWLAGEAGVLGPVGWVVAAGGAFALFGGLLWNLRLRSTSRCACGACEAAR